MFALILIFYGAAVDPTSCRTRHIVFLARCLHGEG